MEDCKLRFKIVFIGDIAVGKTCLIKRFTEGAFPHNETTTVGTDFMNKTIAVENSPGQREYVQFAIHDTRGTERYELVTRDCYEGAHAFVLVYDVTRQSSFDGLPEWLDEIQEFPKALKMLVGNKSDLVTYREVPMRDGQEFAKAHKMHFFETSPKHGDNVDKLFHAIAAKLV